MNELLEAWLEDGRDRIGWSAATVHSYRSYVRNLLAWLARRLDAEPSPADYTPEAVQTHDTTRKRAGKAQRSRAAELCGQQSFARYLHARGLITAEAAAGIERLHVRVTEKPQKVWATPEQVAALFDACPRIADHHGPLLQYRVPLAYAVLAVMAYGGLRRGEVCALEVADIYLEATPPKLVIRQGKGDKSRDVWLAPEAVKRLRAWLAERPTDDPRLFAVPVYHTGATTIAPPTPTRVVGIIREMARLSHIPASIPLACHAFRRFAASQLLKIPGCTLAHVKEFLGHSSLLTSVAYLGSETRELQQLVLQMDVQPTLKIVEGAAADKPAVRRRQNLRRRA